MPKISKIPHFCWMSPNQKVESCLYFMLICPLPDCRSHIGKEVSLQEFRQVLSKILPATCIFEVQSWFIGTRKPNIDSTTRKIPFIKMSSFSNKIVIIFPHVIMITHRKLYLQLQSLLLYCFVNLRVYVHIVMIILIYQCLLFVFRGMKSPHKNCPTLFVTCNSSHIITLKPTPSIVFLLEVA